ncbi:MAG: oligoendopeptidase F [Cyclobacteriaceae bacterium]
MAEEIFFESREAIDEQHKWKLEDLFSNEEEWAQKKKELLEKIPQIKAYQGQLKVSAEKLFKALNLADELQKELIRLYSYASMHSDQDTRVGKYMGMKQEMSQIFSNFSSEVSFFDPEILKIEQETIENFLAEEPRLKVYEFYLQDLMRKKTHRGNEGEEKIMALASLMGDNASSVYNIFSNAEFPYPEIELADGKKVKLNQSNFALQRTSKNRTDREKVFSTFFNALEKFHMTFGAQLYGNLKKDVFNQKARKYESCLQAALDVNNIPVEVYHNLIANVNENLATFHRYLNLRKKMLGVEQLHYYDLYAPLVSEVDLEYTVEEAQQNILESLKPLGEEYIKTVKTAFDQRWIDMFPNEGKRSGAYSNGSAYDVHPYILMNFKGKYDDMSTLMHELGHTMHSYLSNKHQPFPLSHYTIFVAEVASTFNEALLLNHVLEQIDEKAVRLSILGNYLEGAKGTLFRQTQFAEFELLIHQKAEKGEALTGETFSQLYLGLTRKYYGHEQGVCTVDDNIKMEWAYIPHFYYNFYVYQYATSFTASQALSEKVLAGDQETMIRYLQFLSSGGSKYPIDQLHDAGVDMTSKNPFELTIKKMNEVMDEMEQLIG